ncbi:MAG: MarR family winged helix-turn-helix transcriptional regulator [Verrucomicrobium sp.]
MPTTKINPEPCLCSALRRATRMATRLYDDCMKETGLKVTQFSLLRNISRAGTINVTDLAKHLDMERTALGRNLDLLEGKGLIRTESGEDDQRIRVVALTEQGEAVQEAAIPVWRRAQAEMKRRLKKNQFPSLSALFAEMPATTD